MEGSQTKTTLPSAAPMTSPALEWLWKYLSDIRHPHFLDCGSVSASTVQVLLKRGAKICVADLISLLQRGDPGLWKTEEKKLVFNLEEFLRRLPPIPPASLTVICCWHLLDLIPRESRTDLVGSLFSLLEPGGVLFCILREPYLAVGMDTHWWFENLNTLGMGGAARRDFPYPAVTNREAERLMPGASAKTFLTRSGRREIVILKPK
jgi:hypothetical protein